MPEHIKALFAILALATAIFAFVRAPACAMGFGLEDFKRRRNLWYAITVVAFLSHNFWIFMIVAGVLLALAAQGDSNKIALFFFLLFAVPPLPDQISGMGIINQFFTIDYVRLLTLLVLVPAFIPLMREENIGKLWQTPVDKLVIASLVLQFVLVFMASSFTNTLRVGIFYSFIDVFLPYYLASRLIGNMDRFREVLMAFVIGAMVLALVGIFEYFKNWLLYKSLEDIFGIRLLTQSFVVRGENVRAMGSTTHPIVMGYIITIAIGLFLFLKKSTTNTKFWLPALLLLLAGLYVPISRGPWIGFAGMVMAFVVTGPSPGKALLKIGICSAIVIPLVMVSPFGGELIDRLPFIGRSDTESVVYRQRLLEIATSVILQNPFFGASDYFYSAAMQDLKQGEGIIDIVNTYIGVALSRGLVGLTLFVGSFFVATVGVFRAMRKVNEKNSEMYLLGRTLLSVMIAIQIIIFTASSISFIPVIYWSMTGLCVAYAALAGKPGAVPKSALKSKAPEFSTNRASFPIQCRHA